MHKLAMAVAGAALMLIAPGTAYAEAPQVTDVADDAYDGSVGLPNPLLSDPAFDVTAIEWSKTRRDFTVTMTLKGTPEPGVNYFPSAQIGDSHTAWFILRVGDAAYYNVFGRDPATGAQTSRVSTTHRSAVRVVGTTISATFSTHRNRLAPALRESSRVVTS